VQNWNGSKQCTLCLKNEYIHLFYNCYYAGYLWGLTQITFGILPPRNTNHMLGSWTNSVCVVGGGELKRQLCCL
jgi:hypothetical protein